MAVTTLEKGVGWKLTAEGDVASDPGGWPIHVTQITITKASADGTVTFKDSLGNVILLTPSLVNGTFTEFNFGQGIRLDSLEFDAVTGGTAIVYVYGAVTT